MPYESKLDIESFSKAYETNKGRIVISVRTYKNGPKKLQIAREVKNREGNYNYVHLGRLTKDEIAGILPIVQEALTNM